MNANVTILPKKFASKKLIDAVLANGGFVKVVR